MLWCLGPVAVRWLVAVLQCFAVGGRIAAETAERAEREGKVLDDVKCQMCGFLVEDIWSLMVQRSVMDADPINVDRETAQWLENLCTPTPSPILARFVGLYDLRETPSGRYEAVRDAPWENSAEDDESFRDNAEGHNAAVDAKASEPERRWQLRVHQEFCSRYVKAVELDISEAVSGAAVRSKQQLDALSGDTTAMFELIAEGKPGVVGEACQEICEERKSPKKKKKAKKKKKKDKKKKEEAA